MRSLDLLLIDREYCFCFFAYIHFTIAFIVRLRTRIHKYKHMYVCLCARITMYINIYIFPSFNAFHAFSNHFAFLAENFAFQQQCRRRHFCCTIHFLLCFRCGCVNILLTNSFRFFSHFFRAIFSRSTFLLQF